MIAITLNFKSIEAARQALLDIPATALVGGPEPEATAVVKQEATPAPKASKAAKTAAVQEAAPSPVTAAPTAAPAPAVAPAPVEQVKPAFDYATLQKAVFSLAGKSREAAAAVAAGFGVKTFKELPEAKWGEALGAVQEKLAELESA